MTGAGAWLVLFGAGAVAAVVVAWLERSRSRCVCGQRSIGGADWCEVDGVRHRTDGPCYHVGPS